MFFLPFPIVLESFVQERTPGGEGTSLSNFWSLTPGLPWSPLATRALGMSDPSYELGTKLASLGRTTPITALAFLTPALLLAGSSSDLLLTALDARAKGTETYKREWRVLGLERVHKVVVQPAAGGLESWRVLVLGGKEAALVELTCGAAGQQGGYSRCVLAAEVYRF